MAIVNINFKDVKILTPIFIENMVSGLIHGDHKFDIDDLVISNISMADTRLFMKVVDSIKKYHSGENHRRAVDEVMEELSNGGLEETL